MKYGSITTGIIADGLVFNFDAANRACYPKTGTTATDTVDSIEGTLSGPTFVSTTGSGVFNFDGNDDSINLGNQSIGGSSLTSLTVSVWVYKTDTSHSTFIGKYASQNFNLGVYLGKFFFGIRTSSWNGLNNPSFSGYENQWLNVCGVWDGSTRKIYVNASQVSSDSKSGTMYYGSQDVVIGNLTGASGFYYDGKMGPIHFYNRALSANEVLHNYNALKSRFGL